MQHEFVGVISVQTAKKERYQVVNQITHFLDIRFC